MKYLILNHSMNAALENFNAPTVEKIGSTESAFATSLIVKDAEGRDAGLKCTQMNFW